MHETASQVLQHIEEAVTGRALDYWNGADTSIRDEMVVIGQRDGVDAAVAELESQAAPGPWTYQAYAGHHDFGVYDEASGKDVALVRDFNEANARLIAAAPELLAACRELLEIAAECNPQWPAFDALPECPAAHEFECDPCRAKRIARAAIAKATEPAQN